MIEDRDLKEVYREDTKGRKYHTPIITKQKNMGEKEAINQNSEVKTYDFNKPLTKLEFKGLSDDLKRLYISHLRNKYSATNIEIAESMGWDNSSLGKLLKTIGLGKGVGGSAKKRPAAHTEGWQIFINANEQPQKKELYTPTSSIQEFSFIQTGALNVDEIKKRIEFMIPNGTQCKVSINIEVFK